MPKNQPKPKKIVFEGPTGPTKFPNRFKKPEKVKAKKAKPEKAKSEKAVALEDMKQKELRAKAKEVGVKATGSNAKLIERIKAALKKVEGKASKKR